MERKLHDARGIHRGAMTGPPVVFRGEIYPGWNNYARDKILLLDAYRPEGIPSSPDWVQVLENLNNPNIAERGAR